MPQPFFVDDINGVIGVIPGAPLPAVAPNTFTTMNGGPQGRYFVRATPSGARAVVVGQVASNGAITLNDIAPDSAFDNANHIVGAFDVVPRTITINKVG